MGLVSSPAFFCTATESSRGIAEYLFSLNSLPEHPLEHHTLEPMRPGLVNPTPKPPPLPRPSHKCHHPKDAMFTLPACPPKDDPGYNGYRANSRHLYQCYVDDYITLSQADNVEELRHPSQVLLHAIHQIFPLYPNGQIPPGSLGRRTMVLAGVANYSYSAAERSVIREHIEKDQTSQQSSNVSKLENGIYLNFQRVNCSKQSPRERSCAESTSSTIPSFNSFWILCY